MLISLQAICRFGIATSFADGREEASYEEISRACGLGEPEVRRILRHAMANRIFRESEEGVVTHTAASKMLAVNCLMRDWVGMMTEELWPAATRVGNSKMIPPSSAMCANLDPKDGRRAGEVAWISRAESCGKFIHLLPAIQCDTNRHSYSRATTLHIIPKIHSSPAFLSIPRVRSVSLGQ